MSLVGCIPHLCRSEPKLSLWSCVVKICWKNYSFASCLHLLSVILNISLIFFSSPPEILLYLLHLSKAFPTPLTAVFLPGCSPWGGSPGKGMLHGWDFHGMGSSGEALSSSCLTWEKPAERPACCQALLMLCLAWLGMPKSCWAQSSI